MKTIILTVLTVALAACATDQVGEPKDAAVIGAPIDAAIDAPADTVPDAATPDAASCPPLVYGVVPCGSLAPECSEPPVTPEVEGGLHCLPGFEDIYDVPCFCVGKSSEDSWCMREVTP